MCREWIHERDAVIGLPATTQSSQVLLTGPHNKSRRTPIKVSIPSTKGSSRQQPEDREESAGHHKVFHDF